MAYTKFIFDERNELVRRVLATENVYSYSEFEFFFAKKVEIYNKFFSVIFYWIEKIWQLRENVIIQRETEEPPLSPLDIEINIKKWNELQQSNNRSPRSPEVHQRNTKFKAMPNDKENSATKSDRRRSNFVSLSSISIC